MSRDLKRRTRVALMLANAASCLRPVSAPLTEFDEERMTGQVYLTVKS